MITTTTVLFTLTRAYVYAYAHENRLAAETVLKIDLNESEPVVSTMGLPIDSSGGLAKWEGGVLADNGNMVSKSQ